MKTILFFIVFVVFTNTQINAQVVTPKIVSIVMIGKTNKPILDLYIIDSANKNEFKFDEHTIVLYANKSTLNNIYTVCQNEKRYDSLTKYDYSFGTFLLAFRFENTEKVKIVATRIESITLFKKIIGRLSHNNQSEAMIIKEIDHNLLQKIN